MALTWPILHVLVRLVVPGPVSAGKEPEHRTAQVPIDVPASDITQKNASFDVTDSCTSPAAPEGRSRIASKYKKREEARREIRDDAMTSSRAVPTFSVGMRITRIHHNE